MLLVFSILLSVYCSLCFTVQPLGKSTNESHRVQDSKPRWYNYKEMYAVLCYVTSAMQHWPTSDVAMPQWLNNWIFFSLSWWHYSLLHRPCHSPEALELSFWTVLWKHDLKLRPDECKLLSCIVHCQLLVSSHNCSKHSWGESVSTENLSQNLSRLNTTLKTLLVGIPNDKKLGVSNSIWGVDIKRWTRLPYMKMQACKEWFWPTFDWEKGHHYKN